MPNSKILNQKWIHFLNSPLEEPNAQFLAKYKDSFDWQATYDSNSDFVSLAYKSLNLSWNKGAFKKEIKNLNEKSILATLIYDCSEYAEHSKFIYLLKKYLKVDVFGACGMPCPIYKKSDVININSKNNFFQFYHKFSRNNFQNESKCLSFIEKNYKFFIVFEKKICTNYKSERFFNILKYELIPVVLKSYDLNMYLPKESFIEAAKFASVKKLADYILKLNSNQDDYMKFFNWKDHLNLQYLNSDISFGVSSLLCDICIKLNLESNNIVSSETLERKKDLTNYDSSKVCSKLNVDKVVALFYIEELTDKDPNIFSVLGIIKKFFKYDLANLYYSRSFSGMFDKIHGMY